MSWRRRFARDATADRSVTPVVKFGTPVPEIAWAEPHGVRPSFMYKLHESKRRKQLLELNGSRQRIWAFNEKRAGYRLASSLGVAVPELYLESTSMDELDWSVLPDRFAIKPHNGAANRGVFLLVRTPQNGFLDLMDNRHKSVEQVAGRYRELAASGGVSAQFAIEQLLAPREELAEVIGIPDDLKIYCFYDEPAVIMQRRMRGVADPRQWKFKIWTSAWEDVGPVKFADRYDQTLQRPGGGDEVLDAARVIGRHLSVPFVRLDLFDTPEGPVFGEVSPHPGPPERWAESADELLGRQWEIAEARLLAEGILPSEPRPASGP